MVDLDFQGQTIFFKFASFSRSIIIVTLSVLDFLSSSTSIMLKSILKSSLQHVFSQRYSNEGNFKVCLTLIFKINYGGQVTFVSHIEIPNIGYVSNRHQHCVFITYTTHDEHGVTISNSDLDFQGHPLRSSDEL